MYVLTIFSLSFSQFFVVFHDVLFACVVIEAVCFQSQYLRRYCRYYYYYNEVFTSLTLFLLLPFASSVDWIDCERCWFVRDDEGCWASRTLFVRCEWMYGFLNWFSWFSMSGSDASLESPKSSVRIRSRVNWTHGTCLSQRHKALEYIWSSSLKLKF